MPAVVVVERCNVLPASSGEAGENVRGHANVPTLAMKYDARIVEPACYRFGIQATCVVHNEDFDI
jgi:hypothetical protein